MDARHTLAHELLCAYFKVTRARRLADDQGLLGMEADLFELSLDLQHLASDAVPTAVSPARLRYLQTPRQVRSR